MAHHLAVFPGSCDPITFCHLDVIARCRRLFDELVVAVGRNPGKEELFTPDERVAMIRDLCEAMVAETPEGAAVRVESFAGLPVDFAAQHNATALLRGIRNLSDLQYEVQQAVTNREVADLETAFVVAGQSFAYTSSSLIKQLTALGRDLDESLRPMVPAAVIEALKVKASDIHVEPGEKNLRVRYRGDGRMREVMRVPKALLPALSSRLKILAHLDIAARHAPQDGKFRIKYQGRTIDFRLSILPVVGGGSWLFLCAIRVWTESEGKGMPFSLSSLWR